MSNQLVVIVDLGHENCQMIKEDVEALGAETVICPNDITAEELEGLGEIKGFILNGGPCKNVRGFRPEASEIIYDSELPMYAVDHASWAGVDLFMWPKDQEERRERIKKFLIERCKLDL